eukprot:6525672-Pyramimonas_sp.AAC.1
MTCVGSVAAEDRPLCGCVASGVLRCGCVAPGVVRVCGSGCAGVRVRVCGSSSSRRRRPLMLVVLPSAAIKTPMAAVRSPPRRRDPLRPQ